MGNKKPLFEPLKSYLRDEDKELELAKRAINILHTHKFSNIYEGGFDFFSSIFEYLIKDYNKDSGKYAEYFTPLSAGKIIAEILYNNTPVSNVTVYDPAAGSGTLLLSMADKIGTNNCTIYSQDISQKSTQFLRINLILNRLAHSLHNVKEGNTLTMPAHKDADDLMKFDFIVSNPPFKTDFSSMVEILNVDSYNRFFAGVPNIPNKKKDSMAIYLMFLQHIIHSLKDDCGKAAIVVPTGFLTAQAGIEFSIRKYLVENKMLKGVISMPSNIFATTGTNVSILFLDKSNVDGEIVLVDASKLGVKVKDGKNQRTLLSSDEEQLIINTFIQKSELENFSVIASYADIINKNYSFSAGQFFEVKIEYVDLSKDEFDAKISDIKGKISEYFLESKSLEQEILKGLEELSYE
jgi:type I restriction enzyme M protein